MADVDPGYGGYAATNRLLATATNSPEVANQWAQNRLLNASADTAQLQAAHQKLGAIYDVAASVMADPSPENATSRIQDAVRMSVMSAQDGMNELQTINSFGGDQAKIKQYAFDHAQNIASYQQRIEAAGLGTPSYVSNGQQQVPVVARSGLNPGINPASGPSIQMQQSPADLAAPVTVHGSNGRDYQMTQGQFQTQAGQPPGSIYGNIATGRSAVKNGRIVYNGQGMPSGTSGAATTAASGGMPASGQSGGFPGIPGPAPGTAQAADATAAASAAMGNQLTKAADDATARRATLSNLQDQADRIVTGPGAERVNTLKAGVNAAADLTLGPNTGPRFDRTTIAAGEEFHKNAEILAQQQQQALGGTDAALASGKASNPNVGLSTAGNKEILAMLQGNEDAIQAKNSAWQQWKASNGAGSYAQFSTEFNQTFSPRAFQFAHMSIQARNAAVKSMNPQDRAALGKALDYAERQGWIRPQ